MATRAVDPYAAVLDNYFAAEREDADRAKPDLNVSAAESKISDLESALKLETQKKAQGPQAAPPTPTKHRNGLLLMVALLLGGALAFRKIVDLHNGRFNPWALSPVAAANSLLKLRTEEEALSEFLLTFKTGPKALPGDSPLVAAASAESEPVTLFFAKAPKLLGRLRKLLQKISAATNETARRTMLTDLHRELRALKGAAGFPELLPVWQMAAAVEGLVKQLTDNAGNITPSTLRTVAGGVDLLKDLCVPGLRADLLTHPPIRLLAVDDDLISRKAVSLALKKALNQPDLAENGAAALALATEHAYGVIFLDVQMPGMDGFEVCTKIHETVPNAETPVVFVTCRSDFDSRAKSVLSGGSDLIAKPFLTFEITVKALTLALQGRLQGSRVVGSVKFQVSSVQHELETENLKLETFGKTENLKLKTCPGAAAVPELFTDGHRQSQLLVGPAATGELSPGELTRAFLTRASAQLGPLRELIQAIFQTTDEHARQEILGDFYVRFNSLMPKVDSTEGHPALRLSAALEGLLKKLLQNSKHGTSSSLLTIATAVDLLQDLCAMRVKPDLATNPPIRLLAVDDDPMARRAIICALQMAFDQPESVDSGETALALATEKPFDAIFLDVQMPGMDGFTACLRIHETVQNRTTPVVFVTGHSDFKARSQATVSGGSDFMGKPFLTAEITVKALTLALRGRLQKHKMAQNVTLMPKEEGPKPDNLVPPFA